MATPATRADPATLHHAPLRAAFDVSESKLRAPVARPGIVARTELLARLLADDRPPVVSVVAPPGYGKTTLLAQWAERKAATRWDGSPSTTATTTPPSC